MKYLTTIGLEVHVQLKTQSKMFCACLIEYGAPPNTHTCPTCLGLPGGLPVANAEAIRLAVKTGAILEGEVAATSSFDRKNYFYPDLAKNYQITQHRAPLSSGGALLLPDFAYANDARPSGPREEKRITLVRLHLEEDVAKSFHLENSTGIDFNRAGTPLMEIVTEPIISSPDEAFAFLTALRQILIYGEVSDADMEKGQLRCDANVSVRPEAQAELNPKVELKNLNSISAVRRALKFEVERQTAALREGIKLRQETRGWDDKLAGTVLQRTKESEHDYRYFPEPDLLSFATANLEFTVPELPIARRNRLVSEFKITSYDAGVLVSDAELARYFETAAAGASNPKGVANWVLNDLQSALSAQDKGIADCPVKPENLRNLVDLIDSGRVSGKQAKEVFAEMFSRRISADAVVTEKGITQVSDPAAISPLCDEVIAAHPKAVADFRTGNMASLNFLKGQVMKLSGGKVNPQLAGEILAQKLRA